MTSNIALNKVRDCTQGIYLLNVSEREYELHIREMSPELSENNLKKLEECMQSESKPWEIPFNGNYWIELSTCINRVKELNELIQNLMEKPTRIYIPVLLHYRYRLIRLRGKVKPCEQELFESLRLVEATYELANGNFPKYFVFIREQYEALLCCNCKYVIAWKPIYCSKCIRILNHEIQEQKNEFRNLLVLNAQQIQTNITQTHSLMRSVTPFPSIHSFLLETSNPLGNLSVAMKKRTRIQRPTLQQKYGTRWKEEWKRSEYVEIV